MSPPPYHVLMNSRRYGTCAVACDSLTAGRPLLIHGNTNITLDPVSTANDFPAQPILAGDQAFNPGPAAMTVQKMSAMSPIE